jgi:hypothetical protein
MIRSENTHAATLQKKEQEAAAESTLGVLARRWETTGSGTVTPAWQMLPVPELLASWELQHHTPDYYCDNHHLHRKQVQYYGDNYLHHLQKEVHHHSWG